jgi:hypothetical protein
VIVFSLLKIIASRWIVENLSYTQLFFLCVINEKGNLPKLNGLGVAVGIVVCEIMELVTMGVVVRDKSNRLLAVKQYDGSLSYLKPMYKTIVNYKGSIDITDISDMYASTMRMPGNSVGKSIYDLLLPIGKSLADIGYANALPKNSLLRRTTRYAPEFEVVEQIIEKIRTAFGGEGKITGEVLCVAAMLCESGGIAIHFTKDEASAIKELVKETRKSDMFCTENELLYYADCVAGIAARLDFGG